MTSKLTFLILEDHSLVMNAIKSLLEDNYTNCEIHYFKTLEDIKTKVTNFDAHDLLISDLQLEDEKLATHFLAEIRSKFSIPILVITMHNSYGIYSDLNEIGRVSYILKDDLDFFHEAIEETLNGNAYYSPKVNSTIEFALSQNMLLTKRQMDTFKLWEKNKSNAEIAEEMFISIETVKTHKRHIRDITGEKTLGAIRKYLKTNHII